MPTTRASQWREILREALSGTLAAQGQTWVQIGLATTVAVIAWIILRRVHGEPIMSLPSNWKLLETWAPLIALVTVLAVFFVIQMFVAATNRDRRLLRELEDKETTITALKAELQKRNIEIDFQGAIIGQVSATATTPARTSLVIPLAVVNRGPATVLIKWRAWLKFSGSPDWKAYQVRLWNPCVLRITEGHFEAAGDPLAGRHAAAY